MDQFWIFAKFLPLSLCGNVSRCRSITSLTLLTEDPNSSNTMVHQDVVGVVGFFGCNACQHPRDSFIYKELLIFLWQMVRSVRIGSTIVSGKFSHARTCCAHQIQV